MHSRATTSFHQRRPKSSQLVHTRGSPNHSTGRLAIIMLLCLHVTTIEPKAKLGRVDPLRGSRNRMWGDDHIENGVFLKQDHPSPVPNHRPACEITTTNHSKSIELTNDKTADTPQPLHHLSPQVAHHSRPQASVEIRGDRLLPRHLGPRFQIAAKATPLARRRRRTRIRTSTPRSSSKGPQRSISKDAITCPK